MDRIEHEENNFSSTLEDITEEYCNRDERLEMILLDGNCSDEMDR